MNKKTFEKIASDIDNSIGLTDSEMMNSENIIPALVRPGMYAGVQGDRGEFEWKADAVISLMNQIKSEKRDIVKEDSKGDILPLGTPSEAMWGGLARDLMMWLDMSPKTPRALFKHLTSIGREIPQWLRDELEMKHLDHVPSKGTRCVLIWKAMEEARLKELPSDSERDALIKRLEYIMDPSESAGVRLERRAYLVNADLRLLHTALSQFKREL